MSEIPDSAKVPADRQPKKSKAQKDSEALAAEATSNDEPMAVEYNGVSYEIQTSGYGDVDLVEDLQRYIDGNNLVVPRIVERLIGQKQYQAFKQSNRDETGHLSMADLLAFFHAIDNALGE